MCVYTYINYMQPLKELKQCTWLTFLRMYAFWVFIDLKKKKQNHKK